MSIQDTINDSPLVRHILEMSEDEDTVTVKYAKEAPAEEPEDAPETEDGDRGWSRVAGYSDLPTYTREALRDVGPMQRAAHLVSSARALPAGFVRQSEDSFVFVLSDTSVGRDGFVLAGPWNLEEYRLNPVLLYQHNTTGWDAPSTSPDDLLPVGRALQVVEPEEGLLISEVVFDTESERGARLARLYRQGFLSAVSARWWPSEVRQAKSYPRDSRYYNEDPEVYVMEGNRLIEQSAVVIPGLASATLLAGPTGAGRSLSIPSDPIPGEETPEASSPAAEPVTAPEAASGWWGFPKE
jgi:hypothetical protein